MLAPESFHHQALRDLAWLLTTPQLCHCTAESWQIPPPNWDTLVQLDQNPRPIEQWLRQGNSPLLGHYHEQLWRFYFDNHPQIDLLASNKIIQGETRTLGEFDLLLRDRRDGLVWHIELAIKFYLGTASGWGDPRQWSHWLGVACQDSMEHKWHRLIEHQLRLSQQPEVRRTLAPLGLIPDRASALTRGMLFYPWPDSEQSPLPPPADINPNHLQGHWISLSQWLKCYGTGSPEQWRQYQKPYWLASPTEGSAKNVWQDSHQMAQRLCQTLKSTPKQQKAARHQGKRRNQPDLGTEGVLLEQRSGERLYVVADGWPGYIPLPWHRLHSAL